MSLTGGHSANGPAIPGMENEMTDKLTIAEAALAEARVARQVAAVAAEAVAAEAEAAVETVVADLAMEANAAAGERGDLTY